MYKIINKTPKVLLSVLLIALISYTSLDGNPFEVNKIRLFDGADKLIHAVMYFCLTSAFIIDLSKCKYPKEVKWVESFICMMIAFLYSVLMELLQDYMGLGRGASIGDAVANFIGSFTGLLFMKCFFVNRFYKNLEK